MNYLMLAGVTVGFAMSAAVLAQDPESEPQPVSSQPRSDWAESDCTPCGIARIMGAAHAMEEPHS